MNLCLIIFSLVTTKFISFYEDITSMQLKMKLILKRKNSRFKVVSDMWEEEIQFFFLGKCLSNRGSKYFKRFKRISVDVGSIPNDVKKEIIKKYLDKCGHENAADFFRYYAEFHPEFDATEQIEKRERLVNELENDLFTDIKVEGRFIYIYD